MCLFKKGVSHGVKNKNKKSIKLIIFLVLGVIIIGLVCLAIYLIKDSSYFKVKDVIIKLEEARFDLDYLRGRNIFDVDLIEIKNKLISKYPQFNQIKIIRHLPDTIVVDLAKRMPIVQLKYEGYYLIDKEGMIISRSNPVSYENLPIVVGLENKPLKPKAGKIYNLREMRLVFNLLNNANIYHKFFQITKINILTLDNFSFFIDKNIEVKLGLSNQKEKLKILILLLNEIKEKPQDIKYIDLRFKEPIVAKVK